MVTTAKKELSPVEILNNIRLKVLMERINSKKGNNVANDLPSVIDNLDTLCESKVTEGNNEIFLPLRYKMEIFHLLYPTGYIHTEATYNSSLKMAVANSVVYADKDGTILGEGFADQMVSLVPIFDGLDKATQAARRIAKGRAASDALKDAGIASWFNDDMLLDEAVDHGTDDKPAPTPIVSDKADEITAKIKEEASKTLKADNDVIISDEQKSETRPINQLFPLNKNEAEEVPFEDALPFGNDEPEENLKTGIEYAFKLEGGKYPGNSLAEIESKDPEYLVKLLSYIKKGSWNTSDVTKQNLEMVIANSPDIYGAFLDKYELN